MNATSREPHDHATFLNRSRILARLIVLYFFYKNIEFESLKSSCVTNQVDISVCTMVVAFDSYALQVLLPVVVQESHHLVWKWQESCSRTLQGFLLVPKHIFYDIPMWAHRQSLYWYSTHGYGGLLHVPHLPIHRDAICIMMTLIKSSSYNSGDLTTWVGALPVVQQRVSTRDTERLIEQTFTACTIHQR